ncbi:hypothetical protein ACN47E_000890 [Coniothyrium glycines]
MINWDTTGRVYPNRFASAAHGGQCYAIFAYNANSATVPLTLSQTLSALDTRRTYTLRFFWNLFAFTSAQISSCTITVALGDVVIYTRIVTVADGPRAANWHEANSIPVVPSSPQQILTVSYTCIALSTGGSSTTFFDDFSLSST